MNINAQEQKIKHQIVSIDHRITLRDTAASTAAHGPVAGLQQVSMQADATAANGPYQPQQPRHRTGQTGYRYTGSYLGRTRRSGFGARQTMFRIG